MRPAIACTVVVGRVIVDGMSGIHTAAARLPDGSGQVPLTVFRPEGAIRGGIVVLHESRVFPPVLLAFMEVLAAEGWLVVAPNLFHREFTEDDEVFGQNLFDDVDAAMDWLVRSGVYPDAVGVIGFDDAGTAALIVAANRRVGAAVTVAAHGIVQPLRPDVPALVEAVRNLQAPWLGLYGEDDPTPRPATSSSCARLPDRPTHRPWSSVTPAWRIAPTSRRSSTTPPIRTPTRPRRRSSTHGAGSSTGSTRTCADQAFCVCRPNVCNLSSRRFERIETPQGGVPERPNGTHC